nr:GIY-YIG nuclease family protein [Paradevosia shaoguanensis]
MDRGDFPVKAILAENAFAQSVPDWREIEIRAPELSLLPQSWRAKLSEWRGIYLIFDETDGMRYVGSAYGAENILGRWMTYAKTGHGGNIKLKGRNPTGFSFSILERLSPDLPAQEVIDRENSWKKRLHTIGQFGLNTN